MIPLRDTVPSRRLAWVTRTLILLNVAVFVLELRQGAGLQAFLYHFGVVPTHWLVSSPSDFLDWPRLFLTLLTSQFLHAGYLHLASNLLYLWVFSGTVEDRLGPKRFLLLYLGCGVVAAVTQILLAPRSGIPMIGASGAVAGVLGAYLLMFPSSRIVTLVPVGFFLKAVHVPSFIFLGAWFLLQWAQGLTTIGQVAEVGGVAFWAHVGGFVGGMVAVAALPRVRHG